MKKIFSVLFTMVILAGCNTLKSKNPPTQTKQLCSELKSNIIFNTTSTPSLSKASATEQAETLRLYHKYGCTALEKNPN